MGYYQSENKKRHVLLCERIYKKSIKEMSEDDTPHDESEGLLGVR